MKTITLHNKTFEVFIPETEIAAIVHSIANNINDARIKDPLFISVLNGSFMFSSDIMKKITLPNTEISFIKLSSYSGITNVSVFLSKFRMGDSPAKSIDSSGSRRLKGENQFHMSMKALISSIFHFPSNAGMN